MGALDLTSYVWLLEGRILDALKSHCLAIKARNAPSEEVAGILEFYQPYFAEIETFSILKQIVQLLSLHLHTHSREELESMFLSHLEMWARPISSLLRSEPGCLSALSAELKLKCLMFHIETGAAEDSDSSGDKSENSRKAYTEISQEIIQDAVKFGDKYCYVFNCGHTLSESTVQSQLNDFQAIEKVKESFPQTATMVQQYFSVDKGAGGKDKIKSPLCPNCIGSKLLQLAETVVG